MLKEVFGSPLQSERMEIRPASSRYRALCVGVLVGFVLGVLLSLYLFPSLPPPVSEDAVAYEARITELENILAQGDGALTNLQISYSARQQLAEELRDLADRYAALDEDLSYALRLVPVGGPEGGVRLERFTVRADALSAQAFRFSVLVGYESGRRPQEFSGVLQFVLTVSRNGQLTQVNWPKPEQVSESEYQQGYQVNTRHWVRKTGTLEVLPGDVLKKIEVRLMQDNTLRATAAVDL